MENRWQTFGKVSAVGCSLFLVIGLFVLAALLVLQFNADRKSARYPGALAVSQHSNYSGLPFEYRWDDTYRSEDEFNEVYRWYSVNYDLGAESRASNRCILLDGVNQQRLSQRFIMVTLCNTPNGQLIYVTRSTILDGRAGIMSSFRNIQALFTPSLRPAGQ